MASQKDVKNRISSVKNIQKITRAMEMVAAARLRRAEQRIEALRPVRARDPADDPARRRGGREHPQPAAARGARRRSKRVGLLLVTGDRGLAGAFNSQIIRAGNRRARGARGRGQGGRLVRLRAPRRVVARVPRPRRGRRLQGFTDRPAFSDARDIARRPGRPQYVDGKVDRVEIIFNHYVSPLTQEVARDTLLPLQEMAELVAEAEDEDGDEEVATRSRQTRRRGSTSPTPRRSSSGSSPTTSRSPSSGRCSSPPRPSTARA